MESELLLESEMAEYHPLLFDKYHLYLLEAGIEGELDIASLEQDMWSMGNENLAGKGKEDKSIVTFYEMQLDSCIVDSYTLATDEAGAAYRQQAAEYMKNRILLSELYDLYEDAMQAEGMEEDAEDINAKIKCADEEVRNLRAGQNEASNVCEAEENIELSPEIMAEAERTKNPLDEVKELMNEGILSLVIDDVSQVSTLALDKKDDIAGRECYKGNAVRGGNNSSGGRTVFSRISSAGIRKLQRAFGRRCAAICTGVFYCRKKFRFG